jgi:sugar phosphate isomerase/epimerase
MGNIISCRTGVFDTLEMAFASFPQAGVYHAEVPPAAHGDYGALADLARSYGVTIATIATHVVLDSEATAAGLHPVIDGAQSIGVQKVFVSAQAAPQVPWEMVITRLRQLAEYAAQHQVVICMETHPPFGANGDMARRTLTSVGHRGLRFNFDTANIYYYNHGTDTITELEKVADLVASVHLKDTDGGFQSPIFPPIGAGVVDFRGVFRILGKAGFTGPYTLEIEGENVSRLDPAGRQEFLRTCVDYLHRVGAMD